MNSLEVAIDETVSVVTRIGKGDLTHNIEGDFHGSLAAMKEAINTTQTNLSYTVGQVRLSAENVASGTVEISSGNQDLSSRTSEQAASLEETAASMEQIASTVKLSADNAAYASQLVQETEQEAGEGAMVVEQAIGAMERVSDSSGKISDIITLIDGISFQTNLLALNAAVEAARAGEQGRGFAVVAGEVRTLAQRSADAAKDIKSLIDSTTERVSEGRGLVDQTGEALKKIQDSVGKVSATATEIASAAQEQTRGIEQINTAISQLDDANQGNAALVEETAASSSALSEQAKGLTSVVSIFKLN
jgi:methyl-accepting chemotaxis protein